MMEFINLFRTSLGIICGISLFAILLASIVYYTIAIIKGEVKLKRIPPSFAVFLVGAIAYGGSKAHLLFQKGLLDNNSNTTNGLISWTADVGFKFTDNQFVGLVHSNAENSVVSSNSTTYGSGSFNYGKSVTNDYVYVWWYYPDVDFYFDEYIYDNGSCATPELIILKWNYEIIPSYSTLFIDYRLKNTDNDFVRLGSCPVSDLELRLNFSDDPRNYEFLIWTSYIPTPTVHTNGVWSGKLYYTKSKDKMLLLDAIIMDHGRVIGTPKQVDIRRENQLDK